MSAEVLIPHLFRTEFSRLTAVLCRHFGIGIIDQAEDIASETFLAALETWPYKGLPDSPVAWLHAVAKNKARNRLNREHIFNGKVAPGLKRQAAEGEEPDIDLSSKNLRDSQLLMFFAVCHPAVPPESQIALALRILCGFGVEEIATAFIISPAAVSKRLVRAKESLRKKNVRLEMPAGQDLAIRYGTVLKTIYLIFNEGYYSESQNPVVREELCLEAMRLNQLLLQQPDTNTPEANALMALMCFHSSRLAARRDAEGGLILYEDQDETRWNQELVARGSFYFKEASNGNQLSACHLEAGIAWWHTQKRNSMEKWESILQLYNRLLQLEYSPVAALNRSFAFSKVHGAEAGIREAEKLQLTQNSYYFILLAELYLSVDREKSADHYRSALALLKTENEKRVIHKKIAEL